MFKNIKTALIASCLFSSSGLAQEFSDVGQAVSDFLQPSGQEEYVQPQSTSATPTRTTLFQGPETPFDGFYVGLGVDYSDVDITHTATTEVSGSETENVSEYKYQVVRPTLLAGFGRVSSSLYIGSEVQLMYSKAGKSSEDGSKLHSRKFASGDVRLGLVNQNFLLYGLAGLTLSQLEVKYEEDPSFPSLADKLSFNEWTLGIKVGAGIEYALTQKLRARLEYSWNYLGSHETELNFIPFL